MNTFQMARIGDQRWNGMYNFEEHIENWMAEYTAQQQKQTISDAIHTSSIERKKNKM